jgi:hypothetical protein
MRYLKNGLIPFVESLIAFLTGFALLLQGQTLPAGQGATSEWVAWACEAK